MYPCSCNHKSCTPPRCVRLFDALFLSSQLAAGCLRLPHNLHFRNSQPTAIHSVLQSAVISTAPTSRSESCLKSAKNSTKSPLPSRTLRLTPAQPAPSSDHLPRPIMLLLLLGFSFGVVQWPKRLVLIKIVVSFWSSGLSSFATFVFRRACCNMLADSIAAGRLPARGANKSGGARTASACPRNVSFDGRGLVSTAARFVSYIYFAVLHQSAAAPASLRFIGRDTQPPRTETASRMAHLDYYSFEFHNGNDGKGLEHPFLPDLPTDAD
jgi:hypothetical protein